MKMSSGGHVFAAALYRSLLVLALLYFSAAAAAASSSSSCTSSCGSVGNISYPFRLKDDPKGCGRKDFELVCEKNRPILYLFGGAAKYYVLAINYSTESIRVVDVGIDRQNCSSLPLHSFSSSDLVDLDHYPSKYLLLDNLVVAFMNCERPLKSPFYFYRSSPYVYESLYYGNRWFYITDPAVAHNSSSPSCFNHQYYSSNRYVILATNYFNWLDLPELCTLEMVVLAVDNWRMPNGSFSKIGNLSLMDIHDAMANGFKLLYIDWSSNCLRKKSHFRCLIDSVGNWVVGLHVQFFDFGVDGWAVVLLIIGCILVPRTLIGIPLYLAFLVYKFRRRHLWMIEDIESFLQSQDNLGPINYSYSKINKMTNGFNHKLGEGGFGHVYKGKLRSGRSVAIKMLKMSKANGQQFINEVATIGRIHHVNVVRLLGFHAGRSKCALIYDFMPNGSLEKYIFFEEETSSLSYKQMFNISLGVARGIEYLHGGCDMKILHFDIKPHNILLDKNFVPKVSDFGLAKLYPTNDSIVSLTAARGTFGYMAPELLYNNIGAVSHKADVYSFGILLMEMAGRRRNLNAYTGHASQIYLPSWVYDQFNKGKEIEMGDASEEERVLVNKMMLVALWCIQMKPIDRPSMRKVVEMLEGSVELIPMPPKPSICPQEMLIAD